MKNLCTRSDDEVVRGRRVAEDEIISFTGGEREDHIAALIEDYGAEHTRNPAFSRGYIELMAEYQCQTADQRAALIVRLFQQRQIRRMSEERRRRKSLPK